MQPPDSRRQQGVGAGSLALALSGFSIEAQSELSEGPPPASHAQARRREVAAGTAAVVAHARTAVACILERWHTPGYDPQQDAETIASLCFTLQSTVGMQGRLSEEDEALLFEMAGAIWGASLQALAGGAAQARAVGAALERMGSELFALLDGDADCTQDCARYISFFSKAAASWQAAGHGDRARWCLEKAMRYSQQLEAQVANGEVPMERKEGYVVALFNLYLEGAKSAADNRQQALANNLLSRAVQLSRHAAVGPDAAVCCAIAVAELQLRQARQMLSKGGSMGALAVALLSSSYQQLSTSELQAAAASSSAHQDGLLSTKKQVLTLLCKAHLAGGDANAASKVLDALDAEAPGAAAEDHAMQLMFVEARVLAGRVPEALHFLMERIKQAADLAAPAGEQAAGAFLVGLRLALRHLSEDTLHSFQSAVSSFVWKATVAPAALLSLVQSLLADDQGSTLCYRLALQALSSDDVSAALHRDAQVLAQVHSTLWHRAAHCFESGSFAAAKELFSAAFQFCKPEARSKNARALAACHSRLGMHQRAVEYLDIAARHEQQPSSLTQLARLQALVAIGDAPQALATIRSLGSSCPDFHPSLIAGMCQAASKAQHPAVPKEALSTAVQMLIKPEQAGSSMPPGQEAELLLAYTQAIDSCLRLAQPARSTAPAPTAGAAGVAFSAAALYAELVSAVKLAMKRVKLLGWDKFEGPPSSTSKASRVHAICVLACNQLLAAQQNSAHEHVVALATAMCLLLPLADQHLNVEATGAVQQAKILLLAAQALLDLHSKQPDGPQKLALAAKLQAKIAQHLSSLAPDQHVQLHLAHHLLCMETAVRQKDSATLLQCLGRLQPLAARLQAPQRARVLEMVASQQSMEVQQAAAALLFDSIAAEGGMDAALLLPSLLTQLTLPSDQHCKAVQHSHQLLAAIPSNARTASWTQCSQWLAVHAWNVGSQLVQSTSSRGEAVQLMAAATDLLGACAPTGACQLQRMRAAMAAAGMGAQQGGTEEQAGAEQVVAAGSSMQGLDPSSGPLAASPKAASSGCSTQQPPAVLQPEPAIPTSCTVMNQNAMAVDGASGKAPQGANQPADVAADPGRCTPGAAACSGSSCSAGNSLAAAAPDPGPHTHLENAARFPTTQPHLQLLQPAEPPTAAICMAPAMAGNGAASLQPAMVDATHSHAADVAAVEAEDSLSEDEEPAGPSWLDAVFAAQKRAFGSSGSGVPPKRRAIQGPMGGAATAARASAAIGMQMTSCTTAGQGLQQKQGMWSAPAAAAPAAAPAAEDDNADALSLADSMPGGSGFMGL